MIDRHDRSHCHSCGVLLTSENRHGGTNVICKKCHSDLCKAYRERRRKNKNDPYADNEKKRARVYYHSIGQKNRDNWIIQYKTPCLKCGMTDYECIVFHHIIPDTKLLNIGGGTPKKEDRGKVVQETRKCICLCQNCHYKYHHQYGHKPKEPIKSLYQFLNIEYKEEIK